MAQPGLCPVLWTLKANSDSPLQAGPRSPLSACVDDTHPFWPLAIDHIQLFYAVILFNLCLSKSFANSLRPRRL